MQTGLRPNMSGLWRDYATLQIKNGGIKIILNVRNDEIIARLVRCEARKIGCDINLDDPKNPKFIGDGDYEPYCYNEAIDKVKK